MINAVEVLLKAEISRPTSQQLKQLSESSSQVVVTNTEYSV
jgi:hypothetical protein